MQFSECVHTFSMDTELRNDRIPRNPFDRQFLDMRYAEALTITKIRSFKHEPFFFGGGGKGGAYSWYFTVYTITTGLSGTRPAPAIRMRTSDCTYITPLPT